jgi:hypothetical protein
MVAQHLVQVPEAAHPAFFMAAANLRIRRQLVREADLGVVAVIDQIASDRTKPPLVSSLAFCKFRWHRSLVFCKFMVGSGAWQVTGEASP